jgi:hypothetical protein
VENGPITPSGDLDLTEELESLLYDHMGAREGVEDWFAERAASRCLDAHWHACTDARVLASLAVAAGEPTVRSAVRAIAFLARERAGDAIDLSATRPFMDAIDAWKNHEHETSFLDEHLKAAIEHSVRAEAAIALEVDENGVPVAGAFARPEYLRTAAQKAAFDAFCALLGTALVVDPRDRAQLARQAVEHVVDVDLRARALASLPNPGLSGLLPIYADALRRHVEPPTFAALTTSADVVCAAMKLEAESD